MFEKKSLLKKTLNNWKKLMNKTVLSLRYYNIGYVNLLNFMSFILDFIFYFKHSSIEVQSALTFRPAI